MGLRSPNEETVTQCSNDRFRGRIRLRVLMLGPSRSSLSDPAGKIPSGGHVADTLDKDSRMHSFPDGPIKYLPAIRLAASP